MSIAEYADELPKLAPAYLDKPVVDLSEIKGEYDFSLEWTGRGRLESSGGLSIFDSVSKYLGLKLESKEHAQSLIVVDHASRVPAEN